MTGSAVPSRGRGTLLFPEPYDSLNLWFGLVLLVLGAAALAFRFEPVSYRSELLLLTNFVFLNTTHVGFTFAMLLDLPESADWLGAVSPLRRRVFLGGMLATYVVVAACVLGTYHLFPNPLAFVFFAQVVLAFARTWHTIGQVRGLSILYNRLSGSRDRILRLEKVERILFDVFTYSVLAKVMLTTSALNQTGLAAGGTLSIGLSLLVFAALVGIFATVALQVRYVGWKKLLYIARIWLFPIGSMNLLAFYFTSMFHGVEYLCVYRKMTGASRLRWETRHFVIAASVILITAAIPVLNYFFHIGDSASPRAQAITWLAYYHAFTLPITFVHYFADGMMYRMSNPETRRHVGKLLMQA